MTVKLIVAMNSAGWIGKDNDLLWKNKEDMRFFAQTTTGHVVIMGRKTFESMGSKPLPSRVNIVVTSQDKLDLKAGGMVLHTKTLEQALSTAQELGDMEGEGENLDIFLIGGKRIYEEGFPYVEEVLWTRHFNDSLEGDVKVNLELWDNHFAKHPWSLMVERQERTMFNDADGEPVAELIRLKRIEAPRPIPTNTSF